MTDKTQRPLHAWVAIEQDARKRAHNARTAAHRALQSKDAVSGLSKTYTPFDADAVQLPPESTQVQIVASELLAKTFAIEAEAITLAATKDQGNRAAGADIVVDGAVLATDVPVTQLVWLEKVDWHTLVEKTQTLPDDTQWSQDPNSALFRADQTESVRFEPKQVPIVLFPATPEHPAQTQLVKESIPVGRWKTQRISGALPRPVQAAMLVRIAKLARAIKLARSEANAHTVAPLDTGAALTNYVLG